MAPLLTRKRILAVKAEGTPGTAEALTAAEAAHNIFDPKMEQITEMEQREEQGGVAMLPAVPGGRLGKLTFTTEMYGTAAVAPSLTVLLPAVGLGIVAGTYKLDLLPPEVVASTQETLTFGLYQDGLLKQIHGAQGNLKIVLEAGKKARCEWEFTGIWDAPTDVALLDPTYPTEVPMRFVSSGLQILAYAGKVQSCTIDLGNVIHMREDSVTASGYKYACITSRLPKVTVNPESVLVATADFFGQWLGSTEAAFSAAVAAGAATCTMTATEMQIISPKDGDRNGLLTTEIEAQLNADDLTLTFA